MRPVQTAPMDGLKYAERQGTSPGYEASANARFVRIYLRFQVNPFLGCRGAPRSKADLHPRIAMECRLRDEPGVIARASAMFFPSPTPR
ncbi:MAG: hypothetical protein AAF645_04650, partial [Myxococcota bacterium]